MRFAPKAVIDMFGGRTVVSIGYDPSLADAHKNDPTIGREIGFRQAWRASTLIKVNVSAAISPYRDDLAAMADPVGPLANHAIRLVAKYCAAHDGILLAT
jgi:hypothetical protein